MINERTTTQLLHQRTVKAPLCEARQCSTIRNGPSEEANTEAADLRKRYNSQRVSWPVGVTAQGTGPTFAGRCSCSMVQQLLHLRADHQYAL
jgi:hypothetical protein